MFPKKIMAATAAVSTSAWLLAACGGGGGGGSSTPTGPMAPADPTWTSGMFSAPANFARYCAAPRSGTDPATGHAYPDLLGSIDWENNWIRAWTNAYYLWYSEVVDANPAASATTAAYFDLMKTTATTASGNPKDKFHFTYPTSTWEQLSQSDVNIGYGVAWALVAASPPRKLLVAYVDANTPATAAMLARGASVITIDGVDLANGTNINTLNAGIAPSASGQSHTFVVEDIPGGPQRMITMVSASITENPVPTVATFPQGDGGVVGYIEFNAHVATAEAGMVAAVNQLASANVTDLVLDIRYNGGGYLDIASEVAYMVAGPVPTAGKTFEEASFNAKYPTTNPITGQPLTPTPFHTATQGFSTSIPAGQALPHLDLPRVFVLTTADTCSASEAIINGLRGAGISVIQIGSTTCGKPYGFYPQDNCGTTYFSIQFKGVNNAGFGDYPDGFTPMNSTRTVGYDIPGCAVADDYTHALGNPAEGQFAAALGYRANNGACPAPSAFAQPGAVVHVMRPQVLMSRIMRRP